MLADFGLDVSAGVTERFIASALIEMRIEFRLVYRLT